MFKTRCSKNGEIMGNFPNELTEKQHIKLDELAEKLTRTAAQEKMYIELKAKSELKPELPEGAKTHCEIWLREQIYKRKKTFSSKYCTKGNNVEDDCIKFIGKRFNLDITKNEQHYSDPFKTGTPDVNNNTLIIDNKASWDCFTFPLFSEKIPDKKYWWQGQGYMDLLKIDKYKLCYVLADTPPELIEKEAQRYCWDNDLELTHDIWDKFEKQMTYPDISDDLKIKTFDFNIDKAAIDQLNHRVLMCREYIDTLIIKNKLKFMQDYK